MSRTSYSVGVPDFYASRKKRRGIFYTPATLSAALTTWAVRSPMDVILEPGFGECVFLDAIADRLVKLGALDPAKLVFGCDVQRRTLNGIPAILRRDDWKGHFVHEDFLRLKPANFEVTEFDIVMGNPPYVSRHNMYACQRAAAEAAREDCDFRLPLSASLWAFFVLHSMKFLRSGGRMAWILPASAVGADYARKLFAELCARFERISVISLREKVFKDPGAEESSELLLCENYCSNSRAGTIAYKDCANIQALKECLVRLRTSKVCQTSSGSGSPPFAQLTTIERRMWDTIVHAPRVVRLGQIARISIGIVTGRNRFFIVNEAELTKHNLPLDVVRPVFAKFGIATGLTLTTADLKAAGFRGERWLLLHVEDSDKERTVRHYCRLWPARARKRNVTIKKRESWLRPDDDKIPDAFLTYMSHYAPRAVINEALVNCSNTIHRLWFNEEVSETQQRTIPFSLLSTFSQLGAELHGRTYGGGVLKHELAEAAALPLIIPNDADSRELATTASFADTLLRHGERQTAQSIADAFACATVPGLTAALPVFQDALARLRARRWRRTNE